MKTRIRCIIVVRSIKHHTPQRRQTDATGSINPTMKSKPTLPISMPTKKPFWALIIFLVVLFTIWFVIFSKPSPTEPTKQTNQNEIVATIAFPIPFAEQWLLYEDTATRFSIKYPSQTHRVLTSERAIEAVGIGRNEIESAFSTLMEYSPPLLISTVVIDELAYADRQPEEKPPTPFVVWIFANPDNLSIDDWYQFYGYYPSIWGKSIPSLKEENRPRNKAAVANSQAQFFITQNMGTLQLIFVPTQDHMLLFEIRDEPNPNNVGNQILSTVQFR